MRLRLAIAVYLVGIVVANLLLVNYGAGIVYYVGFFIIPLELLTRDVIHLHWKGHNLWFNMGVLMFLGAVLTILINSASFNVVLASVSAYLVATCVNTLIYDRIAVDSLFKRMIYSSIPAAILDSTIIIFWLFGCVYNLLALQIIFKCSGVLIWTSIYTYGKNI